MTDAADPNGRKPAPTPTHPPTKTATHCVCMHACWCMYVYACMHLRMYTCDSLIDGIEIGDDVLQFGQHCFNAHAHSLLPCGSLANRCAQHIPVAARPVCVCVCVCLSVLDCVGVFAHMRFCIQRCVHMYMYTHTHSHTHIQNRTWLQRSGVGVCCRPPSIWRRGVASGAWRG